MVGERSKTHAQGQQMHRILCGIRQFASAYSDLLLNPLFLLAISVGLILRLYQITLQIPADDEWHAVPICVPSTGPIPVVADT